MGKYLCETCGASFPKLSQLLQHRRTENHWKHRCESCNKSFSKKQNLERHVERHNKENNQHCPECLKVFARENALNEHLHQQHGWPRVVKRPVENQEGGGATKRQKLAEDPSRFYNVEKVGERKIEKFRSTATYYKVNIKDMEVDGLPNILKTLKQIFQSILNDITHMIPDTDLVRLSIDNPELDFPITLEFMRRRELTVDKILSEIERVLQSYQQFVVDEAFRIDIVHVQNPYGKGHAKKPYVDIARLLQTKGSVIQIRNNDELCCARAIVTAIARIENHPKWNSIRQGCAIQKQLANELHQRAGVPLQTCGLEEVKKFQAVLPDYQIHVLSKDHFNGIIFEGTEGGVPIYLYYHDKHFDVITKMTGFLNRSYFCLQCKKGYNNKETHTCNSPCMYCHQLHTEGEEIWMFCDKCNRHFKNDICYQMHLKIKSESGKSTCETYYKCTNCDQTVNKKLHKKEHVCHEIYCKTCKDFYAEDHMCYMQPVSNETSLKKTSDKKGKFQYIFFDFECTQDDVLECEHRYTDGRNEKCGHCKTSWCGTFQHVPNLCVVHKVCEVCLNRPVTPESFCKSCHKNERVFQGFETTEKFCQWLFSEENSGATVICHNFKGYDSYPILQYLHDNSILPKVITTGSKYMSVEVPICNIRMIDSLNFIPMALADMPKSFGETELAKGYFPHLFNRKENQQAVLSHLPDIRYYTPDNMKPEARKDFMKWYEQNKNSVFTFQKEILRYCRSDVDILRKCCLKFRELFMGLTKKDGRGGIDPFEKCVTIASACNLVYRTNFLEHESIAIIPPHGYRPEEKQSIMAYKWLSFISHKQGIEIQHGKNYGEKHIGPYKVDGYYELNGEKIAMEFHGCFWHGCPKCFSKTTKNPVTDMSMSELYARTMEKKQFIENNGYSYVSIWECDFNRELKKDPDMKQYVDSLEIVNPLEPRDAFFGGRTEAFTLYNEATAEKQIKYFDVTSLYPWVNKTGKVPIGHPQIITENFKNISQYEGLIKCKVLPPKGLYIPVLPIKCNSKLMFSLCRTCAEHYQQGPCKHSDGERAMIGTWVTDEVKMALKQGYTLQHIYEVWHFDNISQYDVVAKTGGLFTEYVNTFLKVKQEASGWPDWCVDENTKQKYIQDYFNTEGIVLDYVKIEKNPGLRSLAKLMLNSFWGKFGQRTNLTQTTHISDPQEFFEMMTSDQQKVKNVQFVNNEYVKLEWVYNDDFVEPSARTNVIIAAYTTAQARLKLYSYLQPLDRRVQYCDTDSIVFTTAPGQWEPPLGDYLGDLTNEVPGNNITHFVTGGPKNYAYRLATQNKTGNKSVCKVRGITLNFKNSLDINFQTVKALVTGMGDECVTVEDEHKIVRNSATGHIITKCERKDYKIVLTSA